MIMSTFVPFINGFIPLWHHATDCATELGKKKLFFAARAARRETSLSLLTSSS